MQDAEKRLHLIFTKYKKCSFTKTDYSRLDINKSLLGIGFKCTDVVKLMLLLVLISSIIMTQTNFFDDSECYLKLPSDVSKWFREPESCDICVDVTEVTRTENVSASDFYANFVIPSKPVIVTDGTKYWSASGTFTFDFFKGLYLNSSHDGDTRFCQFFPYKTEFASLQEALEMDPKRARLEMDEKSWYIGWSNCNDHAGKILRRHYDVPYFLPHTSENIALNWLFMGGPGPGAHLHVDNVQFPSWQAQVKGKKLWRLVPPPECYYKCVEMQAIVHSGEIIVVDTNRWYHQTFILAGDISITIGSEFD